MRKRMLGNVEVSEIGMGLSHGYGPISDEDYRIEAICAARFDRDCDGRYLVRGGRRG